MGGNFWIQRLCLVEFRKLLLALGFGVFVVNVYQGLVLTISKGPPHSTADSGSVVMVINNSTLSKSTQFSSGMLLDLKEQHDSELEKDNKSVDQDVDELLQNLDTTLTKTSRIGSNLRVDDGSAEITASTIELGDSDLVEKLESREAFTGVGINDAGGVGPTVLLGTKLLENLAAQSRNIELNAPGNLLLEHNVTSALVMQTKNGMLQQNVSPNCGMNLTRSSLSMLSRKKSLPVSIAQMNSFLLQSVSSSNPMKPRWSSVRDRELLSAKMEIKNAPFVRNTPELHVSSFRNVSSFKRSYELMERILKIYIYKEGEKPIFHQPRMRGIYASEGWFMKLIERNKKFVVKDPRKAHLFYLPISPQMLRNSILEQPKKTIKNLEQYLKMYVDLVTHKYRFWNRTGGADHFLVGCHDWASRITREPMGNSIRVLCNANVARGFKIGKDTTLPVTYIRSAENPLGDLGGKPPAERTVLAFFAGGMHGYLRPILLQHWENKEPDMKIFGPMPRDLEGKRMYREYMKNSKYCICARGYEVHTPRVVEAILYECVPVIISDNYVPPFFEVLNWEAFAVFVEEEYIPSLRSILLSIPEEKYLKMQLNVKMVQRHFLWHRKPEKYDLFHMILHSVWYNRVFQVSSR